MVSEQAVETQIALTEFISDTENTVQQTVNLFGLSGIHTRIAPGEGWSSAKLADRVVLSIDPLQLIRRDSGEQRTIEQAIDTERSFILHTICHELSHIRDFMDGDWEVLKSDSEAGRFFINLIDDTVIDARLRNIPLLDEVTEDIYAQVLFPPGILEPSPKHVQFMFGLLADTVTGILPKITADVEAEILKLKSVVSNGATYDIMQVLIDPTTTLGERSQIAETYIKPIFSQFLEEDKLHEQKGGEPEGVSSQSIGFQKYYDDYDETRHGHGNIPSEQNDEDDSAAGSSGMSESNEDSGKETHEHNLMQQVAKALNELQQEKEAAKAKLNQQTKPETQSVKSQTKAASAAGGGLAELELPKGDEVAYRNALLTYRQEIMATAKAFELLAIPSHDAVSPRYTRQGTYSGSKLHTGRLARVIVQTQTGTEQPIWRGVESRGKRVDFKLDKLDVHLAIDISYTMQGKRAECAAASSLILLEAVDLVSHNFKKMNGKFQQADVRTQVIVFGSDHKVVSPLARNASPKHKGMAFQAVSHPRGSTVVSGALRAIKQSSVNNSNRKQLVIVVSDGDFHDYDEAKQIVDSMPHNVHIVQLIIQAPSADTIVESVDHISDPKNLPGIISEQFKSYATSLSRY